MPEISIRGLEMPESPIRKLAPLAQAAKERGTKVYHLNIGQPDLPTPQCALDALKTIDRQVLEYSPSQGYLSYRQKLVGYYAKYGIDVTADDIIITSGGSEAVLFAFMSTLNPGDEIIIPEPAYANYMAFAVSAGATIRTIATTIEEGFALPRVERFEELINERTRAILICNPNNPTGYLYTRREMHQIRDLVKKYDLYLFSDEVYREYIYTGSPYISAMHLEGIEQNTILIDSVSKRYSECGIRIGALVTHNAQVRQAVMKFCQARLSPPLIGQIVAEASLDAPDEYYRDVYDEYVERRKCLIDGLNRIPGVYSPIPMGAFYTGDEGSGSRILHHTGCRAQSGAYRLCAQEERSRTCPRGAPQGARGLSRQGRGGLSLMNLPLYIARRIYADSDERLKVSRPAVRIAIAGVAIGLAVMLISVSVVFGFKHTIREKVIGFGSHIQVGDFMTLQAQEQYPIQMGDSMMRVLRGIEGVRHVQRFAVKQGILKTDHDFLGVAFKGVGPEYDTTFIHQHLVAGSIPHFSDSTSGNRILISQTMADVLQLRCGDRVYAYFIDGQGVRARKFTIQGVYQTNLAQYDKTVCFADLYTAVRLNGWEPDQTSGAEVTVCDFDKLDETEALFIDKVNRTLDKYGETYSSKTIQEVNPQIFHWLDLLDLNVWIILALMVAVAGVTMVSGLLIIILERTTMIGVLKALGASNRTVRRVFLWFSVFIIGRGLLIGDLIGLGLLLLQRYTGFVRLDPTTYYVDTAPVEISIPVCVLLNVVTLIVSVFVLIAPSYLVSHIHPAKSMRYE